MDRIAKHLPWIVGALALAGAAVALTPPRAVRGFDVDAFSQLPVLEGGRVKPIDSVARNSLLMIRSQQSFRHEDRTVGPQEWLLDVMFRPEVADRQPIFVINDPEVLGLMGLQQSSNRYFSFATIMPHIEEIQRQAEQAHQVEAQQRTRFQNAIANLFERLYLYYRLKNTLQLAGSPGLAPELAMAASPGVAQRHQAITQLAFFRPLPPPAGTTGDAWRDVGQALSAAPRGEQDPALGPWARLSVAYMAQDPGSFSRAVAEVRAVDAAARPEAVAQAGHEVIFNRAQPFYTGMVVYVLALLALFGSWAWKPRLLQPVAYGLLVAGALIHTAGLVSRVILQGRPPVTNLYSSAVFVGWAAVLLGVQSVLEGWDAGLVEQTVGSQVLLVVPPSMAYAGSPIVARPYLNGLLWTRNWLGFHAAMAAGALIFFLRDRGPLRRSGALWLVLSAVSVCLGLRFAPRYFFQVLPALAIFGARGVALALKARPKLTVLALALLLLLPGLRFGTRYGRLALDLAAERVSEWTDLTLDQDNQAVARIVGLRARRGDTLLVWGYRPGIYAYAGMRAGAKPMDSQPLTGVPADRHFLISDAITPEWARANRRELALAKPDFFTLAPGGMSPAWLISAACTMACTLRNSSIVAG